MMNWHDNVVFVDKPTHRQYCGFVPAGEFPTFTVTGQYHAMESPKKRVSSDEKRINPQAKKQRKYDRRRIYLGDVHAEWERQRHLSGRTHIAFTQHLLDLHSHHCVCAQAGSIDDDRSVMVVNV